MLLPPRPSSICSTCWNGPLRERLGLSGQPIERSWDFSIPAHSCTGGFAYDISSEDLLSGTSSRCKWCLFVVKHCPKEALRLPAQMMRIRVGNTRQGDFVVIINNVEVRNGFVYTDLVDPIAKYVPRGSHPPDVESQRALALAKACLERCVRQHDSCRKRSSLHPKAPSPRRLIDCTNPLRPRILDTKRTPCVYVTLSYVWGEDQPHKTSSANISSYIRHGIDNETLPQTIRDAIYVAHTLQIQYLWTDGLCIIQDSPEDKRRELASMRDIYRHAYLTIDAASAEKATDGFLQAQSLSDSGLPLPFFYPRGHGEQAEIGTLYISHSVKRPLQDPRTRYGSYNVASWRVRNNGLTTIDSLTGGYTGRRAWCLQETLLSTRCLVFSDSTVQLRCQTTTRNINGAPHNDSLDVPRLPGVAFYPQPRIERYSYEWKNIRQLWSRIVREYSSRSLSYPSDKLVACAALAETFACALGSEYVAGLWDDSFIFHDLLWQRTSWSPRPVAYRAPSWSWASVDGEVSMIFDYLDPSAEALVEVIDCKVAAQSKKLPFGPVSDGSLILRGRLFACASGQESPLAIVHLQLGSTRGAYRYTTRILVGPRQTRTLKVCMNVFIDILIVQVEPSYDFDDTVNSKELWAVPVLKRFLHDGGFKQCEGLLLVPDTIPSIRGGAKSKRKKRRVFQRVGHFRTYSPENAWKLASDAERSPVTATEFELV
ncbi:heterokaryon incompatibility protein-domain-containing protein [Cubamyces menziesii]|nr:heterokaryon incompatibility protein-domain-containing protein [Cubamyces menziesii]